jgi:hypothetical protein
MGDNAAYALQRFCRGRVDLHDLGMGIDMLTLRA